MTTEQTRDDLVRGGSLSRLHWFVMVLSLSLTFVASYVTKREVDARAEATFTEDTERSLGLLSEQLHHYEGALWGGVAAIQANGGDVTDAEWKVYAETLDVVDKYPGANGIGVIHEVAPDEVDAFIANERLTRPDFEIHPPHDQPEFLPITSIEPLATNSAAVGLDMAHEANRYNGISMARLSGLAWMTGPIVLVQDEGQTPGFLFYAPWYDRSTPPTADRSANFVGAVYAPFVVKDLVDGALASSQRSVALTIRDAGEVLFDENTPENEDFDPDPMFMRESTLQLYGRQWIVTTRTTLGFREAASNSEPWIILGAGLLIDGLLLTMFIGLTRSNRRAIRFADDLTSELTHNARSLEQSNVELERFAYVASHDLKTPLRGIGSLAEWIEEDLDEFLPGDEAPGDVRRNLGRLKHQLERMNQLIAGLLEYSRVGFTDEPDATTVDLAGDLNDLRLDLDLRHNQLVLCGPPAVKTTSASLLRQVMSNLVTNAIQHHPNRERAFVQIDVEITGAQLGVQRSGQRRRNRGAPPATDLRGVPDARGREHRHRSLGGAQDRRSSRRQHRRRVGTGPGYDLHREMAARRHRRDGDERCLLE
ncbi:MAG: CHASE domain-containing protein [Acidimicrobiales bacterium]